MRSINFFISVLFLLALSIGGCKQSTSNKGSNIKGKTEIMKKGSYGFDMQFLDRYYDVLELKIGDASVVLIPELQGRVMTSSCEGKTGFSFGWINYDFITSKERDEHFNPFGGEERFWIGPEGGQYSIYFGEGKDFVFENWFVPAVIDTEPFNLLSRSNNEAKFQKEMHLLNYSGASFNLNVIRNVKLLANKDIESILEISGEDLSMVAYESTNTIQNTGTNAWKKETGLLSIWMLGMMIPSPDVTVVIPVKVGDESLLGPKVNDDYFGRVSIDRLTVVDNTIYFKADGKSRGKIGIPPLRANRYMGSYDAQNQALTILECELPKQLTDFVNSSWELQAYPYSGDAFNSYNDGPLEDGSQMGPFYELETSSPALALMPQESYTHMQRTYHFKGSKEALNKISEKVLGINIDTLETVFQK